MSNDWSHIAALHIEDGRRTGDCLSMDLGFEGEGGCSLPRAEATPDFEEIRGHAMEGLRGSMEYLLVRGRDGRG